MNKSEGSRSTPDYRSLLMRALAYLPVPASFSGHGTPVGVVMPDPREITSVERLRREIKAALKTPVSESTRSITPTLDAMATPITDAHLAHLNLPNGTKIGIPNETVALLRQLERDYNCIAASVTPSAGGRTFADFIRNATPEEKEAVYTDVMKRATVRQNGTARDPALAWLCVSIFGERGVIQDKELADMRSRNTHQGELVWTVTPLFATHSVLRDALRELAGAALAVKYKPQRLKDAMDVAYDILDKIDSTDSGATRK